jgi:hypothetical protein
MQGKERQPSPAPKSITFVLLIPSFSSKLSSTKCSFIGASNAWHFTVMHFQQQETRILGMKSPFPARLLGVRQWIVIEKPESVLLFGNFLYCNKYLHI